MAGVSKGTSKRKPGGPTHRYGTRFVADEVSRISGLENHLAGVGRLARASALTLDAEYYLPDHE